MELDIVGQSLALVSALALGLALGLGYDLLRPPRRCMKRAFVLDLIYALGSFSALFALAMAGSWGRLGLWDIASAALGLLLYQVLISPILLPLVDDIWRFACLTAIKGKEVAKKFYDLARNPFSKVKECFTIKRRSE